LEKKRPFFALGRSEREKETERESKGRPGGNISGDRPRNLREGL